MNPTNRLDNLLKERKESQEVQNEIIKNPKYETILNFNPFHELSIDNYLQNEEKMEKNILDKVTMNDVEKDKLIEGLKRNAFSLSNTAKDLGMSRTTLWRKLKKFNIIIE